MIYGHRRGCRENEIVLYVAGQCLLILAAATIRERRYFDHSILAYCIVWERGGRGISAGHLTPVSPPPPFPLPSITESPLVTEASPDKLSYSSLYKPLPCVYELCLCDGFGGEAPPLYETMLSTYIQLVSARRFHTTLLTQGSLHCMKIAIFHALHHADFKTMVVISLHVSESGAGG